MTRVPAKDVRVGDLYLDCHDEWREVVRFYPFGQSGRASFCEISFGSVCVGVPRDQPVWVKR